MASGLSALRTEWPGPLRTERPDAVSGSPQNPGRLHAMTDLNPAVTDLQSRWHTLCDVDRALAVQSMHLEGLSLQKLAPLLNCSPSLSSRLLRAAQAPAADRASAHRREISTPELALRAGITEICGTEHHPEAIAFAHEHTAFQACQTITGWYEDEAAGSTDRQRITDQARSHLVYADQKADGGQESFLGGRLLDEVVRSGPDQSETGGSDSVALLAVKLALGVVRQIPDERVHDRALELAGNVRPDH